MDDGGADSEARLRVVTLKSLRRGSEMPPTFYEFFAGGGMARAGLEPAWRCLFANDIDPKKREAYVANWGAEKFRLGDIHNLKPADLPGYADLAWASFPLTSFPEGSEHDSPLCHGRA